MPAAPRTDRPGQIRSRRPRSSALLALALVLLQSLTSAQDVSPLRLKAAFIWNFAKFTEWPADALRAGEPFMMCVVGNAVVADALRTAINGRELANRPVSVLHVTPEEQPPGVCHVLFVSGVTAKQSVQILNAVRDAPVLSISDIEGAGQFGAMVEFLYEGGRLAFKVQPNAVKRSRLQISSLVLKLSK